MRSTCSKQTPTAGPSQEIPYDDHGGQEASGRLPSGRVMARVPVQPPSWTRLALEQLAVLEFGVFLTASPWLSITNRGDGHPVLVLPGFTGSDRSTQPLRTFLRSRGYHVYGWDLGSNVGPYRRIVRGVTRRLEHVEERHSAPVSLIGWSLGGIYARELARSHPTSVRQV